jgi:hypothetical protein
MTVSNVVLVPFSFSEGRTGKAARCREAICTGPARRRGGVPWVFLLLAGIGAVGCGEVEPARDPDPKVVNPPHVYDKAKYHYETIQQRGLSEEHASNHTVCFLRWLIEHDLMSAFFVKESGAVLKSYRAGKASIHEVYDWWDRCLIDDMLSDEGNAFAKHYFDFDCGRYLHDYADSLQGKLLTVLHIDYSEANYQRIRQLIERRYKEWKGTKKK